MFYIGYKDAQAPLGFKLFAGFKQPLTGRDVSAQYQDSWLEKEDITVTTFADPAAKTVMGYSYPTQERATTEMARIKSILLERNAQNADARWFVISGEELRDKLLSWV